MNPETIQEMVGIAADRFGSRVCIERPDKTATYAEIEEASNKLANFLISQHVASGSIVAILSNDTFDIVTSMIGILKARCVFVPLPTAIPEARLQAMVAEVSPQWFITEAQFSDLLDRVTAGSAINARVICHGSSAELPLTTRNLLYVDDYPGFANLERPGVFSDPDDICYLYFTSGSSGRPKAIAGRLKSIAHFIKWEIETLGITEGVRLSQLTSPCFDAYLRDVFTPLCAGGTICVPEADTIIDASQLIDWIDIQQINIIHCVPSLLRSMLNAEISHNYFSSLKYILMAGERLLPADVKRWMKIFGERVQLINLYGPSETTMTKLFHFVQLSDLERPTIPIGKPMTGARAIVVDEKQRQCPPGVVGEIYIRTPFRSLGYYNQPELTAQAFVQNPFSSNPTDIVYKTGDLGRVLADGNLEFLGRKDLQVKIRGVRIELAEIENLLRSHQAVNDVAVTDLEDINGNRYLCAYLVLNSDLEPASLKDFLADYLPDYMIPSRFMRMAALPRTITGKIDRRALPEPSRPRDDVAESTNPIEEILVGIWAEVLGLSQVGTNENFFELGGHSLLAAVLLARVRKAFQIDLPLRLLFESPTIAQLAQGIQMAVQGGQSLQGPALGKVSRNGNSPLSRYQEGLWFFDQLEPESPVYNIPAAARLEGQLNYEALTAAVNEIVRRHEILRTTFAVENGTPVQIIAQPSCVSIPVLNLADRGSEERESELNLIMAAEASRPFSLTHGPCWRLSVIKLAEQEHVLLLTMHHIISDAQSVEVFTKELFQLYEAFSQDHESPLADLPLQYADYAIWQRDWLKEEALQGQVTYWKQQLDGVSQVLKIPSDQARSDVETYEGKNHRFELSNTLTEKLNAFSRREGATLFMTLLAAFKVMLNYHTQQMDLVVGVPVGNRSRVETHGLIGNFTNTLAMRTDLSANPTFQQLVARVRDVALAAYVNQDVPLGELVETFRVKRTFRSTSIFQVAFNFLDAKEEEVDLSGLKITPLIVETGAIPYDLILTVKDTKQGVSGIFSYQSGLFDAETIAKMAAHFELILRNVVASPDITLSALGESLTETDRQQFFRQEKDFKRTHFEDLTSRGRKAFDIPQSVVMKHEAKIHGFDSQPPEQSSR